MDDLADRYADRGVASVFLYTRESHPGEHYPHHRSMADKRAHATAFQRACGVRRRILLDSLDGAVHRAWGMLPNMTWIVGPGGLILYKSAWTAPDDVEHALHSLLDYRERQKRDGMRVMYTERIGLRATDEPGFRAGLERAGPSAVTDFYGDPDTTDTPSRSDPNDADR